MLAAHPMKPNCDLWVPRGGARATRGAMHGQQLSGRDDTLTATTMDSDLEHHCSLPRYFPCSPRRRTRPRDEGTFRAFPGGRPDRRRTWLVASGAHRVVREFVGARPHDAARRTEGAHRAWASRTSPSTGTVR